MSELSRRDGQTVIRNQRGKSVLWMFAIALFGSAWLCSCGSVFVPVRQPFDLLLMVGAGIWLIIALVGSLILFINQPVQSIELGSGLKTFPSSAFYLSQQIGRIVFEQDPHEDYEDEQHPQFCLATIIFSSDLIRPIRLTVTARDAAHLREWGMREGIPINDLLRNPSI